MKLQRVVPILWETSKGINLHQWYGQTYYPDYWQGHHGPQKGREVVGSFK